MRKGRDGENEMKNGEVKKIMAEIVATTSLPVDRLTATDCNAAARAKSFLKCLEGLQSVQCTKGVQSLEFFRKSFGPF